MVASNKEEIFKKIDRLIKDGDNVFENAADLSKKLECSVSFIYNNNNKIKNMGITYLKVSAESKILEKAEKLVQQNKNIFSSYMEAASALGVSKKAIDTHIKALKNKGIVFKFNKANIEDVEKKAKELVKNKKNIFHSIKDAANTLNTSSTFIKTHKARLKSIGVTINKGYLSKEELFKKAKEIAKNNEGYFESLIEASRKLEADRTTISKYSKELKEIGIHIEKRISEEEFIRRAAKLVEKKKNNFTSFKDAGRSLGVSPGRVRTHQNKLESIGINITSNRASSKVTNYSKIIEEINEKSIEIENVYAFKELAKDFYNTTFNMEQEDLEVAFVSCGLEQITSIKQKTVVIEKAVVDLNLLDGIEDFSLPELKFQILLNGSYISESSILSILSSIGLLSQRNLLSRRFRLAKKISNSNRIHINYKDRLPEINNTLDGSLIIKSSEKEKLLNLWKNYILYLIQNNLIPKSATRAHIEVEKNDTIDSLLKKHSQLKKAFFLEEGISEVFENLGFKGVISLMIHCSSTNEIEERYRSIKATLTGFFMWLTIKGVALMHPKLISFGGNEYLSRICSSMFQNSQIFIAHKKILSNTEVPEKTKRMLDKNNIQLHTYLLASSLNQTVDIRLLSLKDVQTYCETSINRGPSGTISHETYVLEILKNSGNNNVVKKQKLFSLDDYILTKIQHFNVPSETLREHKDLISEIIERTIRYRMEEEGLSIETTKKSVTDLMLLINFLSTFESKPSKEVLKRALNPIGTKNIKGSMLNWAISIGHESTYRYACSHYRLFFNNIDIEHKYHGIFLNTWTFRKKHKERKLIRGGLDYPIYMTLQSVSLDNPPETREFPTKRTSPSGEPLNLSWWPHKNTNPIIAIYNWLCTKLPRRSGHILNLDVNSFLQYENNGKFAGFFINTDKVQDKKAGNKIIPAYYIHSLFTKEELDLLKNYVKYIKEAFSHYQPIKYKNGGDYEDIQPLFPDPENNNVLRETIKTGYFNKVMMKTQLKVNSLAKCGELDYLYNAEELRESKIEYLSNCKLIYTRNKAPADTKIPRTQKELEDLNLDLSVWRNRYTTKDGMHNLRHAGASSLLLNEGWSLLQIRAVTGHLSNDVLMNVYLHENEETLFKIETYSNKVLSEHINEPRKGAAEYIQKDLIPIFDNENPEATKKELKSNGFMSLPRIVKNRPTEIYGGAGDQKKYKNNGDLVDDGIAIAAKFHPGTYEPLSFGLCTIGRRCPSESRGECSLCPHLLFTPANIKGVLQAQQGATIRIALIEEKIKECLHGKKVVADVSNLQKQHAQKIEELMGWNEIVNMINIKLTSNPSCEINNNKGIVLSKLQKTEDCFLTKKVTFNELKMEFLLKVKQLKNEDIFSDGIKGQMSFALISMALENNDKETLKKLQRDSLDWLIEDYGNTAIDDRAKLLANYIKEDSSKLIENKNNKIERERKEDILEVEILT